MQKRKNIILFGSLAFVLLLFGLITSYNNVEALIIKNDSQAVQSAEAPQTVASTDTLRDRDTYNRGDVDRSFAAQETELGAAPDTDTQVKTVDAKIRIGDSGEEVVKLQKDLKKMGFFKEEPSGFFGVVTNDAVVDFQVQLGLLPDGIVGADTLTKIEYGINNGVVAKVQKQEVKEAAPSQQQVQAKQSNTASQPQKTQPAAPAQPQPSGGGKAELLSWFGGAEKVFSIGSVAKVIDVDTGLSFSVKRTYGYNHADVETASLEDTQMLKKIAGGFNWTRRAVIVEVNGRRLAASIAPMPHAGLDSKPANVTVSGRSGEYGTGDNLDTVKGNGMDGHFDMHFYNSRTHGTNSVDANHQAMVQKAYRSGK